ncbi:hypothetical protein GCM10029964_009990 [Kibdelosporangium lantanae]
MPRSAAIYSTVVAIDMAEFTHASRTDHHRQAMHRGLDEILQSAFDGAGIPWAVSEDRGDGKMIIMPPDFPRARMFEQLPTLLLNELNRYNALHVPEARIRLRMAVNAGDVAADESGQVGTAINHTFRIVEARPVKVDLKVSEGVLVLAVSDAIFTEVIAPDPAMEPTAFKQIAVHVKETKATAWLRVYGSMNGVVRETTNPALPQFASTLVEQLRLIVDGQRVPRLPLLLTRAAGLASSPLTPEATVMDAITYLLDLNAPPDGLPRLMHFVELLADELGGVVAQQLRMWNDTRARTLRLTTELGRVREAINAAADNDHCLHLLIEIDHHGLDPGERFLVTHWRQDDPREWPPPRGETQIVFAQDLEYVVEELVIEAETAWAWHEGEVALEFVLPRTLINLPVDLYMREVRSGDPRPLSLDYPIVVRPLERMIGTQWHRVLRAKWRALLTDPAGARVYIAEMRDGESYSTAVSLKEPKVVSMVLTNAPSEVVGPYDELTAALRAGLPAVLWSRRDGDAAELYAIATQLGQSGGLLNLPSHVLLARQAAYSGNDLPFSREVIQNTVLLWDNPGRLDVSRSAAAVDVAQGGYSG